MTTYFLDNGAGKNGNDTNAGTNASAPWATLAHAAGVVAGGDVLFIGSTHAESLVANTTYTFPSAPTNPFYIFCVSDTPWTTNYTPVSADLVDPSGSTASISASAASITLTFNGTVYCRGLSITCGSSTNAPIINFGNVNSSPQTWERCKFILGGTGSGSITTGANGGSSGNLIKFIDCQVKFANSGHRLLLQQGKLVIRGNGLGAFVDSVGSIPTVLFGGTQNQKLVEIYGADLSSVNTTLFTAPGAGAGRQDCLIRNSKINAGVSLISGSILAQDNIRVELANCDSSGTYNTLQVQNFAGTIVQDTANFNNAGATYNGSNGISWKCTPTSNSTKVWPLITPPRFFQHTDTGTSKTLTVQFLFDGAVAAWNAAQLTNAQIWMEVEYAGASTSPISSIASDSVADFVPSTSASNQPTSTATWTSSGLTTPTTGKLTATFTPQLAGLYRYVVKIVGTNPVWIDPNCTVA